MRFPTLFPIIGFGLMALAGCAAPIPPPPTEEPPQVEEQPVDGISSSSASGTVANEAAGKTIALEASNWAFTPSTVTAKKGEKVSIVLTSVSGNHGFTIRELGIDEQVNEGETKTVLLPTENAGTFEFFCSVPCGEGHQDMKGTLVIEE